MAVVMIGMAEVSSVDFDDVKEFKKGDEIGRFHFGGSTHCVVFRPKVKLEFNPEVVPKPVRAEQHQGPVGVCSLLATVAG
jgi:phosphatidylserine decarboxylase